MTHPAYLLARLNPKNVRFDVGSGGLPELTSSDIAAALGYVPDGLGRELLIHVWWPDGGRQQAVRLDGVLTQLQLAEHNRREQAMFAALGPVACGPTGEERRRAHEAYARAHANRWPAWIAKQEPLVLAEGYGNIRRGTLEEIAHPRSCPDCQGRGQNVRRDLVVACVRCEGSGRIQFGPTWRARQLGMKEASYKKTWERPYEWLFSRMMDELGTAERELSKALQ